MDEVVDMTDDPVVVAMKSLCTELMPTADTLVKGCMLPGFTFLPDLERIKNFEVRPDDTWVITFPKSGTTWTQEMVWLLKNNFNFELAKTEFLYIRFPFLEYTSIGGGYEVDSIKTVIESKSPRLIKSHLPLALLPDQLWTVKPKIIYVYRNPKDVALSYCHHYKLFNGYVGTKDAFVNAFVKDKVVSSPFWTHILTFWEKSKEENNIIFISFEEMKKDLRDVARRVANFLNVVIPEDVEDKLLDHLSFASMSKNAAVNFEAELIQQKQSHMRFIRQGEAGAWKKELTVEQSKEFNEWSKSFLKDTDFPYYT